MWTAISFTSNNRRLIIQLKVDRRRITITVIIRPGSDTSSTRTVWCWPRPSIVISRTVLTATVHRHGTVWLGIRRLTSMRTDYPTKCPCLARALSLQLSISSRSLSISRIIFTFWPNTDRLLTCHVWFSSRRTWISLMFMLFGIDYMKGSFFLLLVFAIFVKLYSKFLWN